ncbi:unnamed protein product [Owenia fusiformis]|uniref:Uncharacterized protein n=1 Tax=Owenia fusiformis TaxID=6347 RepID=A0A8S4PLX1_OWEFU|nr:unnamed protein product [Owenia fusiformis]
MPRGRAKRTRIDDNGVKHHIPMTNAERLAEAKRAAKGRRDLEVDAFKTLCHALPYSNESLSKLDKSSLLRLTANYITMKQIVQSGTKNLNDESQMKAIESGEEDRQSALAISTSPAPAFIDELNQPEGIREGEMMLEALNAFVIFVTKKGNVLYVSPNVKEHIGFEQIDLLNKNIESYIHPEDFPLFCKQFNFHSPIKGPSISEISQGDNSPKEPPLASSTGDALERQFYIRMKSCFRKPGNKTFQKTYVYVHWNGRLKMKNEYKASGISCICRPLQPVPLLEVRMDGTMWMSRHSMDMKILSCDAKVSSLMGYGVDDLVGKSVFQFHNVFDMKKCYECHKGLMEKGTGMSKYYRFAGRNTDWVWTQTRATLIYQANNQPQYIVCMNQIIGLEEGNRYLAEEEATDLEEIKQFTKGVLGANDEIKDVSLNKSAIMTETDVHSKRESTKQNGHHKSITEVKSPVTSDINLDGSPDIIPLEDVSVPLVPPIVNQSMGKLQAPSMLELLEAVSPTGSFHSDSAYSSQSPSSGGGLSPQHNFGLLSTSSWDGLSPNGNGGVSSPTTPPNSSQQSPDGDPTLPLDSLQQALAMDIGNSNVTNIPDDILSFALGLNEDQLIQAATLEGQSQSDDFSHLTNDMISNNGILSMETNTDNFTNFSIQDCMVNPINAELGNDVISSLNGRVKSMATNFEPNDHSYTTLRGPQTPSKHKKSQGSYVTSKVNNLGKKNANNQSKNVNSQNGKNVQGQNGGNQSSELMSLLTKPDSPKNAKMSELEKYLRSENPLKLHEKEQQAPLLRQLLEGSITGRDAHQNQL